MLETDSFISAASFQDTTHVLTEAAILGHVEYPPIIVPTERKRDYLAALRLADAGDLTELKDFLGTCVIRSLKLSIKAAKGENPDEPGDVEMEIGWFKRSQEHHKEKVTSPSTEVVRRLYETGFQYLLFRLVEKMKNFEDLFVSSELVLEPNFAGAKDNPCAAFEDLLTKGIKANQFVDDVQKGLFEKIKRQAKLT